MMGDTNEYEVPPGYNHKATSENFGGAEKAVIYYSSKEDNYLVVLHSKLNEDIDETGVFLNATQLELVIHAGTDVLHDAKM
jgi:hypothetical protein